MITRSMMVNESYALLGFMKRWSKEFMDPYFAKNVFTSLVRPVLEYGSTVLDFCYSIHIKSIECDCQNGKVDDISIYLFYL